MSPGETQQEGWPTSDYLPEYHLEYGPYAHHDPPWLLAPTDQHGFHEWYVAGEGMVHILPKASVEAYLRPGMAHWFDSVPVEPWLRCPKVSVKHVESGVVVRVVLPYLYRNRYAAKCACCANADPPKPCTLVAWSPPDAQTGKYPHVSPKGKEEGPLSYACLECWDGGKQCSRSGEQLEGPRFGRKGTFNDEPLKTFDIEDIYALPTGFVFVSSPNVDRNRNFVPTIIEGSDVQSEPSLLLSLRPLSRSDEEGVSHTHAMHSRPARLSRPPRRLVDELYTPKAVKAVTAAGAVGSAAKLEVKPGAEASLSGEQEATEAPNIRGQPRKEQSSMSTPHVAMHIDHLAMWPAQTPSLKHALSSSDLARQTTTPKKRGRPRKSAVVEEGQARPMMPAGDALLPTDPPVVSIGRAEAVDTSAATAWTDVGEAAGSSRHLDSVPIMADRTAPESIEVCPHAGHDMHTTLEPSVMTATADVSTHVAVQHDSIHAIHPGTPLIASAQTPQAAGDAVPNASTIDAQSSGITATESQGPATRISGRSDTTNEPDVEVTSRDSSAPSSIPAHLPPIERRRNAPSALGAKRRTARTSTPDHSPLIGWTWVYLPDRLVAPPHERPSDAQVTSTPGRSEARESTEQEKRLRDLESRCDSLERERDKAVLEKRLSELEERCESLVKERDEAIQAAEDAKRVEEQTKLKMKAMADRVELALGRVGHE